MDSRGPSWNKVEMGAEKLLEGYFKVEATQMSIS